MSADRSGGHRDPAAWLLAALPATDDLQAAQAFCRAIAERHYENFTVATRLVPARLRQDLANVYAFARWSDDLADEAVDPATATRDLAAWRQELEDCFAGRLRHPIFVALADTIMRTGLDIEPFSRLLTAFERDQTTTRFETRADLLDYCRHSADPVGRIVLALAGCREEVLVRFSDSICTGLQLVNFWQDIRRDRQAGRVYLPREDMRRHGVDESMLDRPRACGELVALVRDEVAWARDCFAAGTPLIGSGPAVLRPAIRMFLDGGLSLATAIERSGYDTLVRRPTVGRWTKLRLAARAWWGLRTTRAEAAR